MPIQYDPFPEYRAVLCEECGDEALVYHSTTPVSSLEGRRQRCECCGTPGKVVLLDNEGHGWLEFRAEKPEGESDDSVRGGERGPIP